MSTLTPAAAPLSSKERKRLKKEARKRMVAAAVNGAMSQAEKKAAKKAVMAMIRMANEEKSKHKQQQSKAQGTTSSSNQSSTKRSDKQRQKRRASRQAERAAAVASFKARHKISVNGSKHEIEPCLVTAQAHFFARPVKGTLKSIGYARPTPLQAYSWPMLSIRTRIPDSSLLVSSNGTESSRILAYLAPIVEQLRKQAAVKRVSTEDSSSVAKAHRHPARALILMPSKAKCLVLGRLASQFQRFCDVKMTIFTGNSAARVVAGSKDRRRRHKRDSKFDVAVSQSTRAEQLEDIYKFRCDAICTTPGNLHEALKDKDFPLYGVELVVLDDVQDLMDRGFAPQLDTLFQYLANVNNDSRRASDITLPKVVFATSTYDGSWLKNLPLMSPIAKKWMKSNVTVSCAQVVGPESTRAHNLPSNSHRVVHLAHKCNVAAAAAKLEFLVDLIKQDVSLEPGHDSEATEVDATKLNRAERRAYLARLRKQSTQVAVVVNRERVQAFTTLLGSKFGFDAVQPVLPDSNNTEESQEDVAAASVVVLAAGDVAKLSAYQSSTTKQRRKLASIVIFDFPSSSSQYDRIVDTLGAANAAGSDDTFDQTSVAKGKLRTVVDAADAFSKQRMQLAKVFQRYGVPLPEFLRNEVDASSKRKQTESASHIESLAKIRRQEPGMQLNIVNSTASTQPTVPATQPPPMGVVTKGGWVDRRERRLAPDGQYHTRKEFQKLYGGTSEWNAAPKVDVGAVAPEQAIQTSSATAPAPKEERLTNRQGHTFVDKRERRQADDGAYYTRSEFQRFYGGTAEWDAAPKQQV